MFSTAPRQRWWLRLTALVSALLAILLAIPGGAAATSRWRIVDLGLDHYSYARAINDHGHVVGEHNGRAFLWRNGKVTYLGPSDDLTGATDINNRDEVVGYRYSGDLTTGWVWRRGVMTDLVPPRGVPGSFPTAINDRGEIVGSMGGTGAFSWRDGVMTALPGLPGGGQTEATDINNAGLIVGASGVMNTVPVSWRHGELQPLTTTEAVTTALAVNDRGQIVVGYYTGPHAFLLDRGRSTLIEPPTGYGALQPAGMNVRGQVVGDTISNLNEPFVWQRGRLTLLPRLVQNGGAVAQDINTQGQVVGYAASDPTGSTLNFRAVLWTR